MRGRGAIRILLSLYLWSFILYQILPVKVIPYTSYAPSDFYPKPFLHTYTFAYGVKTAFSNHAGSIGNLLSTMDRMGFDFAFGDFPQIIEGRLFPLPQRNECLRVGEGETFSPIHFLLETLPKRLVGISPDDPLTRTDPGGFERCVLVVPGGRILLSTFAGLEIPSYGSVLGSRRNFSFSRNRIEGDEYPLELLRGAVVTLGNVSVRVFGYSEWSFYLPGEGTRHPFRLVVETDVEKPLIFIYREGKLEGIFDRGRITYPVTERGAYTVAVMSYKFRFNVFYFGLRTLSLASPVRLL